VPRITTTVLKCDRCKAGRTYADGQKVTGPLVADVAYSLHLFNSYNDHYTNDHSVILCQDCCKDWNALIYKFMEVPSEHAS
jgi:hypothetical protein